MVQSLAGIKSAPGFEKDLNLVRTVWSSVSTKQLILAANPKRVYALIQHRTPSVAGTFVTIIFNTADTAGILLDRRDAFQIDSQFPYTGPIYASATDPCDVFVIEAEIL